MCYRPPSPMARAVIQVLSFFYTPTAPKHHLPPQQHSPIAQERRQVNEQQLALCPFTARGGHWLDLSLSNTK